MSRLTPCNYCNLREQRAIAAEEGEVVTLRLDTVQIMDQGVDVFRHPESVDLDEALAAGERDKYWKCWFMALTDHCVC